MASERPRHDPPVIVKALIDYLEDLYPDVMPNDLPSEFEHGKRVGAVMVVRHLKMVMKTQEEN